MEVCQECSFDYNILLCVCIHILRDIKANLFIQSYCDMNKHLYRYLDIIYLRKYYTYEIKSSWIPIITILIS